MELKIPTAWSNDFSKRLKNILNWHFTLQVYGALQISAPTGRPRDVASVSEQNVLDHFHDARTQGIKTNYLLNGKNLKRWVEIDSVNSHETFRWITERVKPDYVTISDPEMANLLHRDYGWENFSISTISGIQTSDGIKQFIDRLDENLHPSAIILHQNWTAQSDLHLLELKNACDQLQVEPFLMLTESCYENCPLRSFHYEYISLVNNPDRFIDWYQIFCVLKRLSHPESLLDLAGFIAPENLTDYREKTGIKSFKISGRSCPEEWILNTVECYFSQKSPENLFGIVVFTTPFLLDQFDMQVNDLFYLDSQAYRKVVGKARSMNWTDKEGFYREQAKQLFRKGKLAVNDPGSIYGIQDGQVKITQGGKYYKFLKETVKKGIEDNNIPSRIRKLLLDSITH